MKLKKLMKNPRVIILIVALILMIVAIHPNPDSEGVAIRSVDKNSSASLAGIESPSPTSSPMSREVITSINNQPIKNVQDYLAAIETMQPERVYRIKTDQGSYSLTTQPIINVTVLDETEEKNVTELVQVNRTINGTVVTEMENRTRTITVNKTLEEVVGMEDIGLTVYDAPTTNIKKGLDLQGGTRVLLRPETELNDEDMDILVENIKERLNVYGLSDIIVTKTKDLSGNQFILVEIAGLNEKEVSELLARQGKFEAQIGNETVFTGGNDITYVCRTADCSGIDPSTGCGQIGSGQWSCRFRFSISLSPEAAQRQAEITQELQVVPDANDDYLNETLDLYLDNQQVDSLNIGADLKGRATTQISISGSGVGSTREQATFDALESMKKLQTVLITGSLPVKLEIVKADTISPVLGEEFLRNVLVIGVVSILAVSAVVILRYRKVIIAVPMTLTMVSEVVLLLGLASLIGWNLDLAAIAGIIIAVGTGVDDQIVITDEVLRKGGKESRLLTWRQRIKRAFFIIVAAYFTTVVAMIPLWMAGAGLLRGFAITTIFGVSFGVFITRPAYAAIVEYLLGNKE